MKEISIITPIYNEDGNINEFYKQVSEFSDKYKGKYNFKFILVNDGSKDNSHEKILNIEDSRVEYIKFSRNFGKEAAIIAGLDHSKNSDASTIIDADLEMPIRYIEEMIDIWENGRKLIIAKKSRRNISKIKAFLAKKYYVIFKKITNQDIVPDALDFVFMDKQVVEEVIKQREQSRFFKGIIASVGFSYQTIDIEISQRTSGQSSYGTFSSLFKYAFMSLANYTKFPLYAAIYIGFISAFIGFIYGIVIIVKYFVSGVEVAGYSSIMCVMLFFFGIILAFLGIVGYYIGLILDETKKRPLYIVDDLYIGGKKC